MYQGIVKGILVNWRQVDGGEDYDVREAGKDGVNEIEYHEPQGEGDRHFCDVIKEDGTILREFNLNRIIFDSHRF